VGVLRSVLKRNFRLNVLTGAWFFEKIGPAQVFERLLRDLKAGFWILDTESIVILSHLASRISHPGSDIHTS